MPQTQSAGIREYELIYVLRPNVDNTEAERVNGRVSEIIESFGGKLTKLDNWGRRRLAYPIQKNARGLFVYAKYVGVGDIVAEVERNLRITDSVLRHQTVLLRRSVQGEVEIDPEELKFAPVEDAEPEEEMALEQRLGLVSAPKREASEGEGGQEASAKSEASDEKKADAEAKKADAEAKKADAEAKKPEADASAASSETKEGAEA